REALGKLPQPGDRQLWRGGERDQQGGGHRAHRGNVGQAPRRRLVSHVGRARPVTTEMAALDDEIRGGHDPAVGRGEHRGVITDAGEHRGTGGKPGVQRTDKSELTELAEICGGYNPSTEPTGLDL